MIIINKKGQIFVEFFAIFIIVMAGFMLFLAAGVGYVEDLSDEQNLKSIELLLDDFKIKTLSAVDSPSDFEATIDVPLKINGNDFDIFLEDSTLIILMGQGTSEVALSGSRLLPGVTGNVLKDTCNLLTKTDTTIVIDPAGC